jgi:hypothetical protein
VTRAVRRWAVIGRDHDDGRGSNGGDLDDPEVGDPCLVAGLVMCYPAAAERERADGVPGSIDLPPSDLRGDTGEVRSPGAGDYTVAPLLAPTTARSPASAC